MSDLFNEVIEITKKEKLEITDMHRLIELSNCNDCEIRYYCAEALGLFNNEKAQVALIKLTEDNDEMVRVNACDSLSFFDNLEVLNTLCNIVQYDNSLLVVQYAILSISDILTQKKQYVTYELVCFLKEILKKRDELEIKLVLYYILYRLGNNEYLPYFLGGIKNADYHIQEFVLHLLDNIMNKENWEIITDAIKQTKNQEASKPIVDIMDTLLTKQLR